MREIDLIVLHCSATDYAQHDNIRVVKEWHLERGFKDVGYHYFINKMGHLAIGRRIGQPGAHAKGYNKKSIGICLSGLKHFTPMQFDTLERLCLNLLDTYDLGINEILAHNHFNKNKTCPNFDVDAFKSALIDKH